MTAALKQAHIALTAIATHPTLELSDFMREKLAAAILAAEAELSQPARVGLTEARILEIRDSLLPSQGEPFDCVAFAVEIVKAERARERAHNIPAAPTQERAR